MKTLLANQENINNPLLNERALLPGNEDIHDSPEREDLIWESFKSGSQRDLTYIYRKYANFLFNYGCQLSDDRDLIKDCLQDLFMDLINHRQGLGSTTSIKFYLMKCFRNKIISTLNKNRKREQVESDNGTGSFFLMISPEVKMIDGQLDDEKQRLIEAKLNELPPLQREAILLYFYEGLKYDQIANLLGIRQKSSRSLIYRSIQSMRVLVAPFKDKILFLVIGTYLLFS